MDPTTEKSNSLSPTIQVGPMVQTYSLLSLSKSSQLGPDFYH